MKIFKSYGFWTALSGALVMLINAIGKCFGFSVEEQLVSDIVMAIAGLLVVFGVVAMPKGDKTENQDTLEETQEGQTQEEGKENQTPAEENQMENAEGLTREKEQEKTSEQTKE